MLSKIPQPQLFCVYCGKDAWCYAPVPAHRPCATCREDHVIVVSEPVCLAHHPSPEEMKDEERWRKDEERRQAVGAAKRDLLKIFERLPDTLLGQVLQDHSDEAVKGALTELREGNYDNIY